MKYPSDFTTRILLPLLAITATACNADGTSPSVSKLTPEVLSSAPQAPVSESPPQTTDSEASPDSPVRVWRTDALIYDGTGTAHSDTRSVEDIVTRAGLTYRTVDSTELNQMTLEEITDHGVILWPGGKAKTMNDSLTSVTLQRIKTAISNHGVGYVGFCAGAFIAGSYSGWGLKLSTIAFPYAYPYYQGGNPVMVDMTIADGSTRSFIWIGGPHLSKFGQVIAKYKDGTSAVAQDEVGKGLVILSGPHPEAPAGWAPSYGLKDVDGVDHDFTLKLIQAALHHQRLKGF